MSRSGSLLAALVAVAALAVVPLASGAKPPTANGRDYLLPNGTVYQLSNGSYHLIPDVATANAMGLRWNHLIKVQNVGPIGAAIVSVVPQPVPAPVKMRPAAVKANGHDFILPNGKVYQLVKGVYRQIPDLATANAMGVRWNHLQQAKSVAPIGAPLPSVIVKPQAAVCTKTAKASVKSNGQDYVLPDGNVYQLSGGAYHLIPDVATANAMGVRWNHLRRTSAVGPIGTPIASVCNVA